MFDRITHGRKLKSQRYAKKGENQKAIGKAISLCLFRIRAKKTGIKAFASLPALMNSFMVYCLAKPAIHWLMWLHSLY